MKTQEIRELSRPELESRRRELREETFRLRMQQQSGQLENPSQLRVIRRDIARIETLLTQKSRAETTSTSK